MKPVAVIPFHDPTRIMLPHLKKITPDLKSIFANVYGSVTAVTHQTSPDTISWLQSDPFFQLILHQKSVTVGEDFLTLYAHAASACHPDQILHLCFLVRVAYILQTVHQTTFAADVQAVQPTQTPLIFQRSPAAWATHPHNYHDIEQMVTKAGCLLFGKSLDFAWCHIVFQAHQLQQLLPVIKRRDLSLVSEFVLAVRDKAHTQDVDWLAWEDPFILNCDPVQLKRERELSIKETQKRLNYAIPMLQMLNDSAEPGCIALSEVHCT